LRSSYVFLKASYRKAGLNGRVVSQAVAIATAVTSDGFRECRSTSNWHAGA